MSRLKRVSGAGRVPAAACERSRGQVIVLVVIAITVLITLVGLANDVGSAWRARLQMQSVADAAAIAGADALFMGEAAVRSPLPAPPPRKMVSPTAPRLPTIPTWSR